MLILLKMYVNYKIFIRDYYFLFVYFNNVVLERTIYKEKIGQQNYRNK